MAAKRISFNTKSVEEISKKIDDGWVFKRAENPLYESKQGLRREGVNFERTPEEITEYIKCKMDVFHFANNYCKVKSEDGSYQIIKLRDYQYDILNMFDKGKLSILMASRQIGKCFLYNTPLFIYNKKTKVSKNIKFFELLFKYKENKSVFDYLKYGLYYILDKIDR